MNSNKLFFCKFLIAVFFVICTDNNVQCMEERSKQIELLDSTFTIKCYLKFSENSTILNPVDYVPSKDVQFITLTSLARNSDSFNKSILNAMRKLYKSLNSGYIDIRSFEVACALKKRNSTPIKINLKHPKDNSSPLITLYFENNTLNIKAPEIRSRYKHSQLLVKSTLDLSDENNQYARYKQEVFNFIDNVLRGAAIDPSCNGYLELDSFFYAFDFLSEHDIDEIIRKSQESNCHEDEQQQEESCYEAEQQNENKEEIKKTINQQKFSFMSILRKYKSYFFGGSVLSATALGLGYLYYNKLWFCKR